jgi:hypothetical protein
MQPAPTYTVNNTQDGNPYYAGKVRPDGMWVIERTDSELGVLEFASPTNNPGQVNGYGVAWAAREALVYGPFHTAVNL